MSTIVIAAQFTTAGGQPATGLTLAEIDLYLTQVHNTTGVDTVVWDGTQHPTIEVDNCGAYARLYTLADLKTYTYFVMAQYTGAVVLDTDYVTGAAGSGELATSAIEDVVDAVWDEILAGHAIVGSTGAALSAAAACGVGSGATEVTYTLTNAMTGLPIADADVWASTDVAGLNVVAGGQTNALGQVTFWLDSGVTYYIWRQKDGFTFVNPDIEVVP